ncbi:MAG: FecR family protein [Candidatus Omnitrophota bacterium]
MKKNLASIITIALVIIAILFLKDFFSRTGEIGLSQMNKTFVVKGDVKIKKAEQDTGWQEMNTSVILRKGDVIETGKDSSVDILMGENANKAIKIKEKSRIEFEGINPTSLNCSNGKVLVTLKKLEPRSSFVVKTPVGICGARSTAWSVEAVPGSAAICVFEHNVFAYGADRAGKRRGEQFTIEENRRKVLTEDGKISEPMDIGEADNIYWKRWNKNVSYLREGKILINDFDRKEYFNNIDGEFGVWNVFYGDPNQSCRDELVESDRPEDAGYIEKLSYDVDSQFAAYNGFFTKLLNIDISNYKYLVFYIKGDTAAGFTTSLKIELKNSKQTGKTSLDGITGEWKRMVIPIESFGGINDFKAVTELVIVFADIEVSRKEGVIYIDDIYFSKTKPADKP